MKTFIVNIPTQIKQKMQSLDVQSILTSTSWEIFNDSGVKEVFIFRLNGELIVSSSGIVTKSSWEYISANQSLLISINNQMILFKPAFKDNIFLALQKDGTSEYLFLIDESNSLFVDRSLNALNAYFDNLEKQKRTVQINQRSYEKQSLPTDAERDRELHVRKQLANEYKKRFDYYQGNEKTMIATGLILIVLGLLGTPIFIINGLYIFILVSFCAEIVGGVLFDKGSTPGYNRKEKWINDQLAVREHNKK